MKNILMLSALIASGAYAHKSSADYTVTCESNSGQTRNCPFNGDGRAYLQTQLSRAGCYEGQTWGTYDNSIWVSNGCRATFRVSQNNYGNYGNRYDSGSSSDSGKAAAAAAAIIIGAAAIAAAHNKDNNHGNYTQNSYNDRYGNNYNNYGNNYGNRSVTCESRDNKRQRCSTHIGRDSVHITRRLSKSGCQFGQDWNYDNNAIYVWNGCRAVFSVY
jgi:Protein of unknown function (DUF3011)